MWVDTDALLLLPVATGSRQVGESIEKGVPCLEALVELRLFMKLHLLSMSADHGAAAGRAILAWGIPPLAAGVRRRSRDGSEPGGRSGSMKLMPLRLLRGEDLRLALEAWIARPAAAP